VIFLNPKNVKKTGRRKAPHPNSKMRGFARWAPTRPARFLGVSFGGEAFCQIKEGSLESKLARLIKRRIETPIRPTPIASLKDDHSFRRFLFLRGDT
jgi:hypothetical protein